VGPRGKKRDRQGEGVYAQGLVFVGDDGLNELHLCVGAQRAERLDVTLRTGFEELLERHLRREDFSGRVRLVILGEITPQTSEIWTTVERVQRELRSSLEAAKTTTVTGNPVVLSVEYTSGEDA